MCLGNAYENAHAEAFNATLKRQEINVNVYENPIESKLSIMEFRAKHSVIRPHSSNGGLTPVMMGFKQGIYSDSFLPSYPQFESYPQRKKKEAKKKESTAIYMYSY